MPSREPRNPTRFLLEPDYWKGRLAGMGTVSRGLLLFPRPDLATPSVEVVEWSLRAHDATRLWGIKAQSHFHPEAKGVCIRQFDSTEPPRVVLDSIYDGCIDFAMQVPPGRRLEDRVLDLVRVWQAAAVVGRVDARHVRFIAAAGEEPDEVLIATKLMQSGLCSLP